MLSPLVDDGRSTLSFIPALSWRKGELPAMVLTEGAQLENRQISRRIAVASLGTVLVTAGPDVGSGLVRVREL
jgi:hypothetical protein